MTPDLQPVLCLLYHLQRGHVTADMMANAERLATEGPGPDELREEDQYTFAAVEAMLERLTATEREDDPDLVRAAGEMEIDEP